MDTKLISLALLLLCSCSKDVGQTNPLSQDMGNESPTPAQSKSGSLLYHWSFDEQNPMHDLAEFNQNVSIVADPLNPSNNVMLCSLPDGEFRAEVSAGTPSPHYFYCDTADAAHGDEIWVGFKLLKPQQEYSYGANTNPSIFQIGPVMNTVTYPGVSSAGHYQLQLNLSANQWRWREFASVYNPNNTVGVNIAATSPDQWEYFVMHCLFRSDDTGLMEIWRNGVKIYSLNRRNGIKNDRTRIKWGVYLGAGNNVHSPLQCYFDEIKIAGAGATYSDVMPQM